MAVNTWIEIEQPTKKPDADNVAPFMGAWIEIIYSSFPFFLGCVAPFMGAWIEINNNIA